eukprot:TRINITY_DN24_c0_g1_i1.p2 TRINITY_DN24_c0_g1~~TRINITY_DN24_c0_g1_i1.p2  ORF type:complete len:137 (-),score=65.08 TRINITY_DN24_c0_g1_i1:92-502(-)
MTTQAEKSEIEQLACTYAALILHDDNLDITEENIVKLTQAANVDVNPYFPKLWANVLKNRASKLDDLITGVGGGAVAVAAAPAAGAAAGGDAPAEKEEKKEEAEDAEEGMGGLFGGSDSDEEGGGMGGLFGGSDSD